MSPRLSWPFTDSKMCIYYPPPTPPITALANVIYFQTVTLGSQALTPAKPNPPMLPTSLRIRSCTSNFKILFLQKQCSCCADENISSLIYSTLPTPLLWCSWDPPSLSSLRATVGSGHYLFLSMAAAAWNTLWHSSTQASAQMSPFQRSLP